MNLTGRIVEEVEIAPRKLAGRIALLTDSVPDTTLNIRLTLSGRVVEEVEIAPRKLAGKVVLL